MNPPALLENRADAATALDPLDEIDAVEEMRLRTWARHNHVPADQREHDWHAVVLDEMARVDRETTEA